MAQTTKYVDFNDAPPARPGSRAVLSAERYVSSDTLEREWRNIWTRCWLFAGLESDIAESGDYFLFNIGQESIVVSRTNKGDVGALYNACQHRGNRILTAEHGSVPAFSCPYHGWSYNLDGRLRHVPDEDRFTQGTPCDQLSLKPVRVECWAGLVWINMDPDAPPLGAFLGPIQEQLAPYRFEKMVLVAHQTCAIDANWKTAIDNFNEQYHVDFIHPQHASMVDCRDAANELFPYGHRRVLVNGYVTNPRYPSPEEVPPILEAMIRPLGLDPADFRERVRDVRSAVQRQKRLIGKELGFDYSGFTDAQISDVYQYDLFPNIIMTVHAERLWLMRVRPHHADPNKCYFDKFTLQIPSSVACDPVRGLSLTGDPQTVVDANGDRPEHDQFTRDDVMAGRNSMTITIDQDIQYLPDMQAGMHSAGFNRAWLNEDESRIQHFHDWIDAWLQKSPLSDLQPIDKVTHDATKTI